MVNVEWIRETFAPPVIATAIAISLVFSWGGREATGNAQVEGMSTVSNNRHMETDGFLQVAPERGNTSMVLLVYRLPLFAGQQNHAAQSFFHRPVMSADRPARSWWM